MNVKVDVDAGEPIVAISNVSKAYRRGGQVVPVLMDLSFDIMAGDFLALMGPSGSGKSTLLNLIAGIDQPDSGSLRVAGHDITRLSEAQLADWRAANVGFIFQFYNLLPVLTAFENVELSLLLTRLTRSEHYPSQLSGGQQQRVAIARAVVTDPTLIVADEPTGDLDRASAEGVLDLLQRLNAELGKTIVMVTHDPHSAGRAHAVRHLEKGVLTAGVEQPDLRQPPGAEPATGPDA